MESLLTPELLRALYEYNAWANGRTCESCSALSEEQFTKDLGSSFRSVRDTLAHILGAEWIWLERWQGRAPSSLPPASQFTSIAVLRARWADVGRDLVNFVSGLKAEDLPRPREYRSIIDGKTYSQPLWQTLQHLVNHGTYHRGQIATLLRQLGTKAVSTDLTIFYRETPKLAATS